VDEDVAGRGRAGGLEGGEWQVERIGDDPIEIARPPTIRFDADGRFAGSTGVNRMFGSYEIADGVLRTSAAGTTMMAGPPEAMAVERRFLDAFGAGGSIELEGDTARIGSGDTQLLLRAIADIADPGEVGDVEDGADSTADAIVTGRVFYRERIAMPPGAVLTVSLLDVSRADAPAELITRIDVPEPGNVPIAFEIPYDRSSIDARRTYSVRATIEVEGRLAWTTDRAHHVITGGAASDVEIMLVSARR
jgi:putative lipoprotein